MQYTKELTIPLSKVKFMLLFHKDTNKNKYQNNVLKKHIIIEYILQMIS